MQQHEGNLLVAVTWGSRGQRSPEGREEGELVDVADAELAAAKAASPGRGRAPRAFVSHCSQSHFVDWSLSTPLPLCSHLTQKRGGDTLCVNMCRMTPASACRVRVSCEVHKQCHTSSTRRHAHTGGLSRLSSLISHVRCRSALSLHVLSIMHIILSDHSILPLFCPATVNRGGTIRRAAPSDQELHLTRRPPAP